jgi:hypothetical protein
MNPGRLTSGKLPLGNPVLFLLAPGALLPEALRGEDQNEATLSAGGGLYSPYASDVANKVAVKRSGGTPLQRAPFRVSSRGP